MADEFLDLLEDLELRLTRLINIAKIPEDELSWSRKYDVVFSPQLYQKITAGLKAIGIDEDEWYIHSDMGYKEDVQTLHVCARRARENVQAVLRATERVGR
jgi:hypothetical protein